MKSSKYSAALLKKYKINHFPDGWHVMEGTNTAPRGYKWIANNVPIFSPERKIALVKEELIPEEES